MLGKLLGSSRAHLGTTVVPLRIHPGSLIGPNWTHLGTSLVPSWIYVDPERAYLGPLLEPTGFLIGSLVDQRRVKLGPNLGSLLEPSWFLP